MAHSSDPRAVRSHERVLAAARELFLEQGVAGLTHLELARRSGVGRKTIYRHWPTTDELIHDTLDSANFPQASRIGDLRTDLVAHLEALRHALTVGPLAFVIHSLGAQAAIKPELAAVRDRLTKQGCAPVREILREAAERNQLDRGIDIEHAAAQLEGPLFYRSLVLNEPTPEAAITELVDQFLAGQERPGQRR